MGKMRDIFVDGGERDGVFRDFVKSDDGRDDKATDPENEQSDDDSKKLPTNA